MSNEHPINVVELLKTDSPEESPAMVGHVIDFKLDGEVQAMHNDKFDLSFLGNQSIERASELKFNEETQTWGIWLHRGDHHWSFNSGGITRFNPPVEGADGFATYDGSRQVEVAWLNSCRRDGVEPTSDQGLAHLRRIREELNL